MSDHDGVQHIARILQDQSNSSETLKSTHDIVACKIMPLLSCRHLINQAVCIYCDAKVRRLSLIKVR